MFRNYHLIVIFFFLLPTLSSIANPSVKFEPAPTWVVNNIFGAPNPDTRNINDGYYVAMFEEEVNVALKETYKRVIRDIFSDAGLQQASSISVSFNPAYEQLVFHDITVWRKGERLNRLPKADFKMIASEDDLEKFIYDGSYTAYLILDDIRTGDKIEYSYTIKGSNPILGNKYFTSFAMQSTDPISQLHYRLLIPEKRKLYFRYFEDAPQPKTTRVGNQVCYDWDMRDIPGVDMGTNSPSWFYPGKRVQVSEYGSWHEVANWAYNINKPENRMTGKIMERVNEIGNRFKGDKPGLFRAVVDIVQNEIRYMGVEIGPYSHMANTPEKVYKQRYGDCKDKSMLLVSMLRTLGIEAHMALVSTSLRSCLSERLPSPLNFNHAIVVARLDDKEIWVDPTLTSQGGSGTDIYFPHYGKALILDPETDTLTPVPDMAGGSFDYTEEYVIDDVKKPVSFTVMSQYSSGRADDLRITFAARSKTDLEKEYLQYYAKTYPGIDVEDTLMIADDKSGNVLKTVEKYTISDFLDYDSASNKYSQNFYARIIRNALPEPGNKVNYPLALTYPYDINYRINVVAPFKWAITPHSEKIERNAYSFVASSFTSGNTLSIQFEFHSKKDHIPASERPQYARDYKKIVDEHLAYGFSYTPGGVKEARGANWLAIIVTIVVLAGFSWACYKIYHLHTTPRPTPNETPRALGGWLIIPMLGMIITVFRIPWFLISASYFHNSLWYLIKMRTSPVSHMLLLWMELLYNSLFWAFDIFCLILFIKRRDILPRMITILYASQLVMLILDSTLAKALMPETEVLSKEVLRSIVAAAIWIPYFNLSARARETFIFSYPLPSYLTDYGNEDQPAIAPENLAQTDNKENQSAENPLAEGDNDAAIPGDPASDKSDV